MGSVDLRSLALTSACCVALANRLNNTGLNVPSNCMHCCSVIVAVDDRYIANISASVLGATPSRSVASLETVTCAVGA